MIGGSYRRYGELTYTYEHEWQEIKGFPYTVTGWNRRPNDALENPCAFSSSLRHKCVRLSFSRHLAVPFVFPSRFHQGIIGGGLPHHHRLGGLLEPPGISVIPALYMDQDTVARYTNLSLPSSLEVNMGRDGRTNGFSYNRKRPYPLRDGCLADWRSAWKLLLKSR